MPSQTLAITWPQRLRCMALLASKVFLYNLLDKKPTKRIDLFLSNTRVNPSDNECLGLRIISNLH